jgi:hypothetical protein
MSEPTAPALNLIGDVPLLITVVVMLFLVAYSVKDEK